MKNNPNIIFLNHASFIIEFNGVKILNDPFLFGSAFNNGWNLIKEVDHEKILKDITHIIFSHEHPDHFSVPFLKSIPSDKILVETDSPYLAPEPLRGKPNQPSYITHTVKFLSDLKNIPYEKFSETTTQNFFNLFGKLN